MHHALKLLLLDLKLVLLDELILALLLEVAESLDATLHLTVPELCILLNAKVVTELVLDHTGAGVLKVNRAGHLVWEDLDEEVELRLDLVRVSSELVAGLVHEGIGNAEPHPKLP